MPDHIRHIRNILAVPIKVCAKKPLRVSESAVGVGKATLSSFMLDKPSNRFSVKPLIQKEWENERFRELIRDRTTYSLKRYFRNKTPNHRTSESF